MKDDNGTEIGFIFVDYTEEGCRVQTVILDCEGKEDARQKADDQLRARGFTIDKKSGVLTIQNL
jgi:hypothetical protein